MEIILKKTEARSAARTARRPWRRRSRFRASWQKAALAAKIDGNTVDLQTALTEGCTLEILSAEDPEGLRALRHTASHVLAEAVKRLFPEAKLAIGPAIDDGFLLRLRRGGALYERISFEDRKGDEQDYCREQADGEKNISRAEAIALMKSRGEDYKVELIEDLPEGEEISLYYQGDFVDLCAGPHAPSTGKVKAFKLTGWPGHIGGEREKQDAQPHLRHGF